MHFYMSYWLQLASELELPELAPSAQDCGRESPDVTIVLGAIDSPDLSGARRHGPLLFGDADSFWLEVPKVARFLIRQGAHITIDPAAGIDEDSIRVFLLGSALGALLYQRGYMVLHGNAVRVGDECLVCVGHSGVGKSTLAAAFMQRGYPVLTDDVVAVDAQGRALPGLPRLKLWQDALDQLGLENFGLNRIRPGLAKFHLPMSDGDSPKPLPIRWIYVLNNHHRPDTLLEPIQGGDRFGVLRNHSYRVRFMEGMALKARHLRQCAQLASCIHLARVTRPDHGFDVGGLVERLLADIRDNP
jgi:hypothetical protein